MLNLRRLVERVKARKRKEETDQLQVQHDAALAHAREALNGSPPSPARSRALSELTRLERIAAGREH